MTQNVRQAVIVQIGHAGSPADEAGFHAEAGAKRLVFKLLFPDCDTAPAVSSAEVGLENVEAAVKVVIADRRHPCRPAPAVLVQCDAAVQMPSSRELSVGLSLEQARGGIAGHVDLGPAVVIEVRRDGGQPVGPRWPWQYRKLR